MGSSLPLVELRDIEQAHMPYDQLGVSLPESFLASLRAVLVVLMDQGVAVAGSPVADSLASVRAHGVYSEGPGSSQGGGGGVIALH